MRHCAALAILIGFLPCSAPARDVRQLQLHWDELNPEISGRKIAMILPDGTSIEGKVASVEQDGLRMNVSKTSDRKVQRKGDALIPRDSVSVIRIVRHGVAGPLLGAIGAAGIVAAVSAANAPENAEGAIVVLGPAVGVAGGIGAGIGGYYLGKAIDKKVTEIRVIR